LGKNTADSRAYKVMKKQTRTAIRLTLTKDKNFHNPKGYAQLIKLAQPLFVEA
jgi:wyosine [tRNA(Phe)-imidazoG37] synthetase (radical SAM superfamily)